ATILLWNEYLTSNQLAARSSRAGGAFCFPNNRNRQDLRPIFLKDPEDHHSSHIFAQELLLVYSESSYNP
ncbi:unnamed protein product, partial [marine sediment metagenome]